MKTTLLLLLLLLLTTTSYDQISTPPAVPVPDSISSTTEYYYLQKSKSQRKIGRILIISGGVLLSVGYMALLGEAFNGKEQGESSDLLLNGSFVSFMAGGVYLFSAKRNRKKAMSVTAARAQFPQLLPKAFHQRSVSTVGLKIDF
ncbi:hypothetical protein [Rufibacter latericius]|uniref:DUF4199 domain-containing protein n=1 Tax=Rufibacter latericius TaxID=2487040 RepID=A0A3M9MVE0_9BACT|nr:hypothetical protein [Rufibacter latericius]RNI28728.1 hypothetical protein EFB08_08845 [Rufibacter latericius]